MNGGGLQLAAPCGAYRVGHASLCPQNPGKKALGGSAAEWEVFKNSYGN